MFVHVRQIEQHPELLILQMSLVSPATLGVSAKHPRYLNTDVPAAGLDRVSSRAELAGGSLLPPLRIHKTRNPACRLANIPRLVSSCRGCQ